MTRVGASRIFFDVVAKWQSDKLIADMKTSQTIMQAVMLDVFDAVLGPMSDVGMMIDGIVSQTEVLAVELGEARIAFEKFVSVDNRVALDDINASLIDMGHNFAMTASETFDAAARMAQMGAVIGETNILIGTQMGVMFSLISGMDTESAMRRITNLQQQTGFMYGEYSKETFKALNAMEQKKVLEDASINTLDALNTVENRSIATMEQLTFTMNQFASQAKLTGSSIEDMAAMSAVMIESGEQAGAAGRSLKMMYARLGGDIGGASTKLQAYGINTKLANGDMKDMMSIMKELKEKGWDQTTSANKQAIAQTIAGNRHYVRFIKLMEGYDRAVQLSAEATDGLASAQAEVNRRLEDPVVILEALNAEIDDYSAMIGTSLLPGITKAAQAQKDFNAELYNFTSGNYGEGFKDIANSLVAMREMSRITGGFLQLQLTIRAIIIGMGAFRSVMAGIAGHQIAIDSAFGATRTTIQGSNMSLEQQKNIMKQIKDFNDQITLLKSQSLGQQNGMIRAKEMELSIQTEIGHYQEQELHREKLYGSQYQLQFTRVKMRKELLKNIGDELKGHALEMMKGNTALRQRDVLLEKFVNVGNVESKQNKADLMVQFQKLLAAKAILDTKMQESRLTFITARSELNLMNEMTDEEFKAGNYAKDHAATVWKRYQNEKKINDQLFNRNKYMAGSIIDLDTVLTKLKIYGDVEKQINATEAESRAILMSKLPNKQKLLQLEKALKQATIDINMEELKSIVIKKDLAKVQELLSQAMAKHLTVTKAETVAVTAGAQAMGYAKTAAQGFSGGLMGISMLAPMIIGGQEGMRISMVATTLSMLPMIGTMGKATISMAAASVAALQLSGAMAVLAGSIGIIGAILAVYYLSDYIMGTNDAIESTQEFTDELIQMESVLNRLQSGQSYMLFEGVEQSVAESLGLMNISIEELKESLPATQQTILELNNALAEPMSEASRKMMTENLTESMAIRDAHLTKLMYESEGYVIGLGYNNGEVMADAMALSFGDKSRVDEAFGVWEDRFTLFDWDWTAGAIGKNPYWEMLNDLFTAGSEEAILDNKILLGELQKQFESGKSVAQLKAEYEQTMLTASRKQEGDWRRTMDDATTFLVALEMLESRYSSMGKTLDSSVRPLDIYNQTILDGSEGAYRATDAILSINEAAIEVDGGLKVISEDFTNLTEEMNAFGNAKDELFFGGKYGNVTGSLYKQVVTQGVGTLYNKQEVIMTNNFNGFFNEEEAAAKIISVLNKHMETGS